MRRHRLNRFLVFVALFAAILSTAMAQDVSPDYPYQDHYVEVFGSRIHYIEQGTGDPILLLHGNPTWSYIWRNVIPHLSPLGRVIAPDFIGYGRSDKPDYIQYSWFDQYRYMEEFIRVMNLKKVVLVLHDHGSSVGFYYAMRHQDNVRGMAFFEAIVRPFTWENFSTPQFRELFQTFRTGGVGDIGWQLIVTQNIFIEQLLPLASGRTLSEKEMTYYREPFLDPPSREKIWRLARDTPIGEQPPDVWSAATTYSDELQKSDIPKLLLYATPGALITSEHVEWCRQNFRNLKIVSIGPGLHFLQESSPHLIGTQVAKWIKSLHGSCQGKDCNSEDDDAGNAHHGND